MTLKSAYETLLDKVARADGIVRNVEVQTISEILTQLSDQLDGDAEATDSVLAREQVGAIMTLAHRPLSEREKLIQLLWIVAICDGELHPSEEALILKTADAIRVPRATVARQQPDF